ncbi:hypothetical protein HOLleu_10350 [Holothuria leucospilota]|uniref:Uncharacterized protein n=1 Tax=Holothuria leucospilota TaxID=206669 RepID=A0A9Q1HFN1_HOLLE|nr:hypothetical protein HOLleu_10350 [Holothuria leucospilota]
MKQHSVFDSLSFFSVFPWAVADLPGCHMSTLSYSELFCHTQVSSGLALWKPQSTLGLTCWVCNHFCVQSIERLCYTSSVDASAVQTVVVRVFNRERKKSCMAEWANLQITCLTGYKILKTALPNRTVMKHCISQVNQVTIQYFMNTQTIMTKQRTGHDSVFPGLGFSQVMENWKGHGILLCIFSGLESNEKLLDLL